MKKKIQFFKSRFHENFQKIHVLLGKNRVAIMGAPEQDDLSFIS